MPRENTPDNPQLPPDADDAELLARELADVKPLAVDARIPPVRRRLDRETVRARQAAASESRTDDSGLAGTLAHITPVAADARLEFHRTGLQLRQWQKLRKGQIPWQLAVDLHGATRAEAMSAVNRLISQAQEEQANCIRVVHGKGQAADGLTIKADLNHWLRRHDQVLAFCSALPGDGGAGALYVLLRRRRD
ncbi:MAG: Smr/MutS family protein [Gammaproteobacteria bacterium]